MNYNSLFRHKWNLVIKLQFITRTNHKQLKYIYGSEVKMVKHVHRGGCKFVEIVEIYYKYAKFLASYKHFACLENMTRNQCWRSIYYISNYRSGKSNFMIVCYRLYFSAFKWKNRENISVLVIDKKGKNIMKRGDIN